MNVTRKFALLLIVVALVGSAFSFAPGASAEAKPEDDKKAEPAPVEDEGPVVTITGGDVSSETVIEIDADGGTAIADASGGDDNFAFVNDDEDVTVIEGEDRGGVLGLRDDLLGLNQDVVIVEEDIAAAGNGGTATASADGGAISVGDINSGGNSGNSIVVGNVGSPDGDDDDGDDGKKVIEPAKPVAHAAKPAKPASGGKVAAPKEIKVSKARGGAGGGKAKGGKGGDVAALPSTGAGVAGVADTNGALLLLTVLGAAGAAGYGLRRRVA